MQSLWFELRSGPPAGAGGAAMPWAVSAWADRAARAAGAAVTAATATERRQTARL